MCIQYSTRDSMCVSALVRVLVCSYLPRILRVLYHSTPTQRLVFVRFLLIIIKKNCIIMKCARAVPKRDNSKPAFRAGLSIIYLNMRPTHIYRLQSLRDLFFPLSSILCHLSSTRKASTDRASACYRSVSIYVPAKRFS